MPASDETAHGESTILRIFVGVLIGICLVAVALLHPSRLQGWERLMLLALLTALASSWSVRFESLGIELTPTDPFVLFALATSGFREAAFLALIAVVGSSIWGGRRLGGIRFLFNAAALPLAAALAGLTFARLGGGAEPGIVALLAPLSAATLVYLLVNTGLTATAIALSTRRNFPRAWGQGILLTAWPQVTALTLTLCMILLVEAVGPLGLALALPPVLALASTQQIKKIRFDETLAEAKAE